MSEDPAASANYLALQEDSTRDSTAGDTAAAGERSGDDCDGKSSFELLKGFVGLCSDTLSCVQGIAGIVGSINKVITDHLLGLSKLNEYLQCQQSINIVDKLKEELLTAQNALKRFLDKVEILSYLLEDDNEKQTIMTALDANDSGPLKKFLKRVQRIIGKFVVGYKDFTNIYDPLEESVKMEITRCVEQLGQVTFGKDNIKYNGFIWKWVLGSVSFISLCTLAAAAFRVTVGSAGTALAGFGVFAPGICYYGLYQSSSDANSNYSSFESQCKQIHTELTQILDASQMLNHNGRQVFMTLQDCLAKADKLLLACKENIQMGKQLQNMLDDMTGRLNEELKLSKAKCIDELKDKHT